MKFVSTDTTGRYVPVKRPYAFKRWFRQTGWRHLVGIVMCVFAAFPLLYVLSASLHPGGTLITANGLFSEVNLGSYLTLFNLPQQPYADWYANTLVIPSRRCARCSSGPSRHIPSRACVFWVGVPGC